MIAVSVTPNECIPQVLRDTLDDARYSAQDFLLKVACSLGMAHHALCKNRYKNRKTRNAFFARHPSVEPNSTTNFHL